VKLLHTSDWHLGRSFHGAPLLDHQVAAVERLVEVVRTEQVEVVLLSGDIYDRQLPAGDAVQALSYALCKLRAAGARIVGIAGNHDSSVRVGFAEPVLAAGGVSIRGEVASVGSPVVIKARDHGPPLAVYPVPYLDAFVAGGASCDSERPLTVGGSAEVSLGALAGFDYVALGHLHGRQVLADGRVRYAGSLLPYSFSERAHTKGAWLLDMAVDGSATVEAVDLPAPRPLAVLSGTLEELLSSRAHADAERAWVHAVLTDPVLPPEAMARLRARFPHAVTLVHEPPIDLRDRTAYAERVKGRTDLELALDFVEHVTGAGAEPDEEADLVAAMTAVAAEDAE
jgi:exonuclease SbcD